MIHSLLLSAVVAFSSGVEIRVDGEGFFRGVQNGRVVFSKTASLVNVNNRLCDVTGIALLPTISLPGNGTISVDLEGYVTSGGQECGRLVLALMKEDHSETGFFAYAGKTRLGNPGEDICGVIRMIGKTADKPKNPVRNLQLTGGQPSGAKGIVITVRPMSEVDGRQFTLGEIAEISASAPKNIELAGIKIGDAPSVGVERGIDRSQVITKLKAAGIDTVQAVIIVPANARVMRACQMVPHQQFVDLATKEATAKFATAVAFKSEREHPEMRLPKGDLQLTCEGVSGTPSRITVVVSAYVDAKRINSRTVVLVPSAESLQLKSGASVTIKLISNGAVVMTKGKLQKSGFAGQVVEVKTDQNMILSGVLLPDGTVEVRL